MSDELDLLIRDKFSYLQSEYGFSEFVATRIANESTWRCKNRTIGVEITDDCLHLIVNILRLRGNQYPKYSDYTAPFYCISLDFIIEIRNGSKTPLNTSYSYDLIVIAYAEDLRKYGPPILNGNLGLFWLSYIKLIGLALKHGSKTLWNRLILH